MIDAIFLRVCTRNLIWVTHKNFLRSKICLFIQKILYFWNMSCWIPGRLFTYKLKWISWFNLILRVIWTIQVKWFPWRQLNSAGPNMEKRWLDTWKFSKPKMSRTPMNLVWFCPGLVHLLMASTSQANVREYSALATAWRLSLAYKRTTYVLSCVKQFQ